MHSVTYPRRSTCAQRTEGITLDHAARVYDWLAPLMTLGLETRLHREVIASMSLDRPLSVLDIGCGTGTLTRQLFDTIPVGEGRWVVGIDAAEAMVGVAHRNSGERRGLQFESALAEDLPYPPNAFDRVVSTFTYHHFHAGLKQRALAETWRVLRPGGHATILDVDVPYSWFGAACAYAGYWLFRQPEIKENIDGRLRHALDGSAFVRQWRIVSRHGGYLSLFEMRKPAAESINTHKERRS